MRDQDGAPLADSTQDYRLPKNVTPERYDIRLTPDLKAFTFAGEENVAVVVNRGDRRGRAQRARAGNR